MIQAAAFRASRHYAAGVARLKIGQKWQMLKLANKE